MRKKISDVCKNLNIEYWGITNTKEGSIFVCLFPYYTGVSEGNLSKYAIVPDYHTVCGKYLNKVAEKLECETQVFVDVSPYNERLLAYKSGLGIIGENGLLINEKYGSYVFIGCILIKNTFLEEDLPKKGSCRKCGRCKKHCPLGALNKNDMNLCLSNISQKKGELSDIEKKALISGGLIWGCDICSDVCPHNKNAGLTPIKEFQDGVKRRLEYADVFGLSQKEFKTKFSDRSFTWRGKNVVLRNLMLFKEN